MGSPSSKPPEQQYALLRFLQREGKVSAEDITRLEASAQEKGRSLFEVLEAEAIIAEKDLAVLLATKLRLRLIDLTSFPFDPQMSRELKETIATRYNVVPIRVDDTSIEVAIANPLDIEALKAVEFATGKRVHALVATRQEVADALGHVYRLQESLDQFLQHVPDEAVTLNELLDEGGDLRTIAREAELPPVVKLADLILIEGIKSRASDVHIEPGTDAVAVRYRLDGILEESFRFPKWVQNALIARLKVMAKLDITERRIPQDGRIQLRYTDRIVDLRVSSLPAQHGEKITLRILDASTGLKPLDRLGFGANELQRLRDAIRKPEGLILVTGPTGSGKTTTLYALLREKLSPNLNIVTIENPIEYQLKGINQVEVNDKQGLTFAGVLRSVLRQDPDVILVGEIRDKETAQIAMQAAQTGHLVLSTVHTNDAPAAVTRLVDLGIEPFVVASTIHLVVAQRLVRRVCQACSEPYTPSEEHRRLLRLDDAAVAQLRQGRGCPACRQTGFAGRSGVYEVMPISPAMTKLIEGGANETAIRQLARVEGFASIAEGAQEKLLAGQTTPDEMLRVVQVNEYTPRCPGCQRDVADDYTVCPHCSAVLRTMCRACGKPFDAAWTSCAYCGAAAKPDASGATEPAAEGEVRQRTYKALVVDDNAAIRDIVRLTLERSQLNLSVVLAEDGAKALALAATERPDVVILDLQMPNIDGFEVCRRLRSDVHTAFVPVLMLTAQTGQESVTQGFASGADDYVTKPFKRQDLLTRIRRMLERTYGKHAVAPEDPAVAAADFAASAGGRGVAELELEAVAAGAEAFVAATYEPAPATAIQPGLDELRGALQRLRVEHERALEEVRANAAATAAAVQELRAASHDAAPGAAASDTVDTVAELRADLARREAARDAQITALTHATDLTELRASVRDLAERLEREHGAGGKAKGRNGSDGSDVEISAALRAEMEALRARTQEIDERVASVVRREGECGALRGLVEQHQARLNTLAARLEGQTSETDTAADERVAETIRDLAATRSGLAATESDLAALRSDLGDVRRIMAELTAAQESAVGDVRREIAELGAGQEAVLETRVLARDYEREIAALRGRTEELDERLARVRQEADAAPLRDVVAQQGTRLDGLADRVERELAETRRRLDAVTSETARHDATDRERERATADALAAVRVSLDAMQAMLGETSAEARRAAVELIESRIESVGTAVEEARAAHAAATDGTLARLAADTDQRVAATLQMIEELRRDLERQAAERDATFAERFLGREHARELDALCARTHELAERLNAVAGDADGGALRDALEEQGGRLELLGDRLERELDEARRARDDVAAEIARRAEIDAHERRATVELVASRLEGVGATLDEMRTEQEARFGALVARFEHDAMEAGRAAAERDAATTRELAATRADLGDLRRIVAEIAAVHDRAVGEVRRELEAMAVETGVEARRAAAELLESRVEGVRGAFEEAQAAQAESTQAAVASVAADTAERLAAIVQAFEELRAEVERQLASVREIVASAAVPAADADELEVSVSRLERLQRADREAVSEAVRRCETRLAELECRVNDADDVSAHVVEEVSGVAAHLVALRDVVQDQQREKRDVALHGFSTASLVTEYADALLQRISDVSETISAILEYAKAPIIAALSVGAALDELSAPADEEPDQRPDEQLREV